ncbi:hypothetical protein QE418_001397 [Microbacterium testaceum]|nr:hypothetical protein [Microbacterium testaceum]MDR6097515.1 hypothetical protein [Microbacterium sp. SORGH_AS_0454]
MASILPRVPGAPALRAVAHLGVSRRAAGGDAAFAP